MLSLKFKIFQQYQSDDNIAQLSDIDIDKAVLPVRWLSGQHFKFIEIELLQIALATSQLTRIMTFYNTINELLLQSEYHNLTTQ